EAEWADRSAPEEADEPAWTAEQVAEAAQKADQAIARRQEQIAGSGADTTPDSEGQTSQAHPTRKDLKMARTRLRWIVETEIDKVAKYEDQLQTMGERNSYSSTDPDATFKIGRASCRENIENQ